MFLFAQVFRKILTKTSLFVLIRYVESEMLKSSERKNIKKQLFLIKSEGFGQEAC